MKPYLIVVGTYDSWKVIVAEVVWSVIRVATIVYPGAMMSCFNVSGGVFGGI